MDSKTKSHGGRQTAPTPSHVLLTIYRGLQNKVTNCFRGAGVSPAGAWDARATHVIVTLFCNSQ